MSIDLLPGWDEKIASATEVERAHLPQPPLSPAYLASSVHLVLDQAGAQELVQAAYESPVTCIAIDSEYKFTEDEPVALRGGKDHWRDIRSIISFCLALVIISAGKALRFVVDLRVKDLLPLVQKVLDLPVHFVLHYAKAELFLLWSLSLREPRIIWDTHLAERALHLGTCPLRARSRAAESQEEAVGLKQQADAVASQSLSLDSTAARYGIAIIRHGSKHALQSSFLTKPFDEPLTQLEAEYCAEDAQITAEIRAPQRVACDRAGISEMLDRVVMPWNVTAAEIQWTGVLFDRDKCRAFLDASALARDRIGRELQAHGITKPGSTPQLCTLLKANRLDHHFSKTKLGRPRTRDQDLKDREHLHPAISLVRRWRKVGQLAADPAVQGLITGVDGRVHSDFIVLGADSGRTQSRRPNLMGLGRAFRPLVRAEEGYGIGEVDLSEFEVEIAAGVFRDPAMIADFNSGDVYIATAKRVFKHQIRDEDLRLSDRDFRERYPQLRDKSKLLVLGIIYGKTVHGIAIDLGISRGEAQALWDTFRSLYPILCDGMERARTQSIRRGYAYISGLRRFRAGTGSPTPHEERGMGNAYVQGTAALVFFDAGNRLRRLYRQHRARLIIPVHDAFVFEAPVDRVVEVAELTESVLVRTVQEWFPDLRPRTKANITHPECWNHDGHHDSVERFINDPMSGI